MKKITALLLAVFLMVSILSGCGNEGGGKGQGTSATGETGEADDTLVVGAAGEPSSLDPHATSLSSANAAVQTSMFATLFRVRSRIPGRLTRILQSQTSGLTRLHARLLSEMTCIPRAEPI